MLRDVPPWPRAGQFPVRVTHTAHNPTTTLLLPACSPGMGPYNTTSFSGPPSCLPTHSSLLLENTHYICHFLRQQKAVWDRLPILDNTKRVKKETKFTRCYIHALFYSLLEAPVPKALPCPRLPQTDLPPSRQTWPEQDNPFTPLANTQPFLLFPPLTKALLIS